MIPSLFHTLKLRLRKRDRAWAISSVPYTGLGGFLTSLLPLSPAYSSILHTLSAGGFFLDIGCFIGHDLRRLAFDGAPSDRLYGIDNVNYWDIGYDMFHDRDRFYATFLECNILRPSMDLLSMAGEVGFDVIALSMLLHMWDWDDQIHVLKYVVKLAGVKGMAVGCQIGNVPAKERVNPYCGGKGQFWHDAESFTALWSRVSEITGTNWLCEVAYRSWEECEFSQGDAGKLGESAKMMTWVAKRQDTSSQNR